MPTQILAVLVGMPCLCVDSGQCPVEELSQLDEPQVEELSQLEKCQVEELSQLEQCQVEELSQLEQCRVEELSQLDEPQVEELSQPGQCQVEELSQLEQCRVEELSRVAGLSRLEQFQVEEPSQLGLFHFCHRICQLPSRSSHFSPFAAGAPSPELSAGKAAQLWKATGLWRWKAVGTSKSLHCQALVRALFRAWL